MSISFESSKSNNILSNYFPFHFFFSRPRWLIFQMSMSLLLSPFVRFFFFFFLPDTSRAMQYINLMNSYDAMMLSDLFMYFSLFLNEADSFFFLMMFQQSKERWKLDKKGEEKHWRCHWHLSNLTSTCSLLSLSFSFLLDGLLPSFLRMDGCFILRFKYAQQREGSNSFAHFPLCYNLRIWGRLSVNVPPPPLLFPYPPKFHLHSRNLNQM